MDNTDSVRSAAYHLIRGANGDVKTLEGFAKNWRVQADFLSDGGRMQGMVLRTVEYLEAEIKRIQDLD